MAFFFRQYRFAVSLTLFLLLYPIANSPTPPWSTLPSIYVYIFPSISLYSPCLHSNVSLHLSIYIGKRVFFQASSVCTGDFMYRYEMDYVLMYLFLFRLISVLKWRTHGNEGGAGDCFFFFARLFAWHTWNEKEWPGQQLRKKKPVKLETRIIRKKNRSELDRAESYVGNGKKRKQ